MSTEASSSSSTPKPEVSISDAELEKLLNREASAFQRELEVERILVAFKLNPYDILDLTETARPEDVKRKYRQLSLFIHPDKTPHARAPEAFDILKKAESELSDPAKREELDATISQARIQLLKSLSLPPSTTDDDPKLKDLKPPYKAQLRAKSKDMLIEEELRRRKAIKMNLANEGLEARKKEEEVATRKRKAEDDKKWEENREQRVDSWRTFTKDSKKKKKQKVTVLG
ncbi:DnaJ-domain-containing protein [Stereum hirsutum FP-91666 SS1]|uniref:DnaJ-domain-containing protein n=1 Tax=Stereum hirsutum (strain FP-91666) TaxID=721885 RepID=UPI000440CD63|nr:DnaJ-domain-containing protein [Stereum hirsutum FP-91666 SS1]EIM91069.1 DnaJ-domain-containing protein [Stereum hirsutum FP-91666 SS1]